MRIGGLGFDFGIEAYSAGNGETMFAWKLMRFGRELARGAASSKKEANEGLWQAYRKVLETKKDTGATKNNARVRLRQFLGSRPYLLAGVLESLLVHGTTKENAIHEAREAEKAWWRKDAPEARLPLPTHRLALTPEQGAERIYNCLVGAGIVHLDDAGQIVKRYSILKYAQRIFGSAFKNYGAEDADEGQLNA